MFIQDETRTLYTVAQEREHHIKVMCHLLYEFTFTN